MYEKNGKKINISRFTLITAFVILCFSACLLLGCADTRQPALTTESITLSVGDSRDILPYVVFPPSEENRSVVLTSDSDRIEIEGTTVRAVSAGEAVLSVAFGGTALALKVSVIRRAPAALDIIVNGKTEQTVERIGEISDIDMVAYIDCLGYTDGEIEWSVDGQSVGTGREYKFTPSGYGEYAVRAAVGEVFAERVVRVYRNTETVAWYEGEIEQNSGISEVRFFARERLHSMNPPSVYLWTANGEFYCNRAVCEFTPPGIGVYEVSLYINGKRRAIGNNDSVSITVAGDVALHAEVLFDDIDGVFIRTTDGSDIARVSIFAPDGKRFDIDSTDAQHSYMFDGNEFDASEYIQVCAAVPGEYRIITQSVGVCETVFTQYPLEVSEFLEKGFVYENSFLSSEEDCAAWTEELYACGIRHATAYVDISIDAARRAIETVASTLRMPVEITANGRVFTVVAEEYVNSPDRYVSADVARMYSVMPHIVTDGRTRGSSYVFDSDRASKSAEVSGSEQLLYALRRGLRPVCAKASTANVIYTNAKNKLLGIIGVDWTAEQKVHAIYDWLQWITVCVDDCEDEDSSRFLESVFGSAELPFPDTYRQAAVTSEGCAKLFEFLCLIEGIECVSVGIDDIENGYYRNKVELDGQWYIADVFGGRIRSAELGISRPSELSSHRGLLISDEAAGSILTGEDNGENAFDDGRSPYLKKHKNGNEYFDFYIDGEEVSDYQTVKSAVYRAFDNCPRTGMSIPGVVGIEMFNNGTVGCELATATLDADETEILTEHISRAAGEYIRERYGTSLAQNGLVIYRTERNWHIIATIPHSRPEESL